MHYLQFRHETCANLADVVADPMIMSTWHDCSKGLDSIL